MFRGPHITQVVVRIVPKPTLADIFGFGGGTDGDTDTHDSEPPQYRFTLDGTAPTVDSQL